MTDFGSPSLFNLLSAEDCEFLASLGERRRYNDGEVIHRRSDKKVSFMEVVIEGRVRFVRLTEDGQNLVMAEVNVGQNYGDSTTMMGSDRAHDAIAIGDTVIDHYSLNSFQQLLERPGIVRALYQVAAYRLTQALEYLDDIRSLGREVHLAKLLMLMRASAGGEDRLDCLQENLASQLGVSTMTLTKALRTLKREGLVETGRHQITIVDPTRMNAWLTGNGVGV